MKDRH